MDCYGQDYLHEASLIVLERALILITMWLVLYTLGAQLDTEHSWALWSILALVLVLELVAYRRGVVQGMEIYRKLTPSQKQEVDRILKDQQ